MAGASWRCRSTLDHLNPLFTDPSNFKIYLNSFTMDIPVAIHLDKAGDIETLSPRANHLELSARSLRNVLNILKRKLKEIKKKEIHTVDDVEHYKVGPGFCKKNMIFCSFCFFPTGKKKRGGAAPHSPHDALSSQVIHCVSYEQ